MKLNLGCGTDYREGFVNIDNRTDIKVDKNCDVSMLPFPDGCIEHILANDILEHFSYREVEKVLKEWVRVLSPGGTIRIMVPNLKKIYSQYADGTITPGRVVELLFGGQTYPGNFHHAGFDRTIVKNLFKKCGLEVIKIEEALNNIAVIGKKYG